jgi:hypothetical protein
MDAITLRHKTTSAPTHESLGVGSREFEVIASPSNEELHLTARSARRR